MAKNPISRRFLVVVASTAALVTLSGVPGLRGQAGPSAEDRATVVHVLNRVGFGPRPGDVERVSRMGVDQYVRQQLAPAGIDDSALETRLASFETLGMSSSELFSKYFGPALALRRDQDARAARAAARGQTPEAMAGGTSMAPDSPTAPPRQALSPEAQRIVAAQRTVTTELMQAKMLRAVSSERQLQEVLTDFWFNHFNVFIGKGQVRQYLTEYERDAIRPYVLGSFREMLGKVARSPAMLFYLDNFQSSTPNAPMPNEEIRRRINDSRLSPQQRQRLEQRVAQMAAQMPRQNRGLNENYARELMELHTLGVDAGYTQKDVVELARILTGWTIDQPRQGGGFVFRPAMHDTGTKTLLGKTFGAAGEAEGDSALDLLAAHPATARHIAHKLAQRFVADEPPAALVDRAAKTFMATKGDLREVTRVILTSPEFLGPAYRRVKVKTPFEFVASAIRATDATLVNAQPLVTAMQNLGMPLYGAQPPTGYAATSDAWVNTGALLNRMNFAVEIVSGGRVMPQQVNGRGVPPAAANAPGARRAQAGRGLAARGPVRIDVASLAPGVDEAARTQLIDRLLDGQASESTRQTLARAETPPHLVALALGSPEFQRR